MDIRGFQPLRDDGEQLHTLPARSIRRGPPDGLIILQAAVPARSMAGESERVIILNFGHTHGSACFKIMDVKTEMIVHSREVIWH